MTLNSYYIVAPTERQAFEFAKANKIGNAVYYGHDKALTYLCGTAIDRIVFVGDPPEQAWQALRPALIGATEILYASS